MIIKIDNTSKNFYAHLGKVFGSREVERLTGDRIYDDDNKEWYLYYKNGVPNTFVSIKNNVIKNIWGYEEKYIIEVLEHIKPIVKESIVTKYFKELYIKAGYEILDESSKNFIKIRGGLE